MFYMSLGNFENIKIKNQQNERNNTTFKLILKVSVKIPNLRYGVVHT